MANDQRTKREMLERIASVSQDLTRLPPAMFDDEEIRLELGRLLSILSSNLGVAAAANVGQCHCGKSLRYVMYKDKSGASKLKVCCRGNPEHCSPVS